MTNYEILIFHCLVIAAMIVGLYGIKKSSEYYHDILKMQKEKEFYDRLLDCLERIMGRLIENRLDVPDDDPGSEDRAS